MTSILQAKRASQQRFSPQLRKTSAAAAASGEEGCAVDARFQQIPTGAERRRVFNAALPLVEACCSVSEQRPGHARSSATRYLERTLSWLDALPGSSYQDRWERVDADNNPGTWCPELARGGTYRAGARMAINALIIIGTIRPTYEWLFASKQSRFWRDWTIAHDTAAWRDYFEVADQEHAPERRRWSTAAHLIRISVATGTSISNIQASDVLNYRDWLLRTNREPGQLHSMWQYGRRAGLFAGEPDSLSELLLVGQLTPARLVERYTVKSESVRQLLVEYISELATTQDYASLENSSRILTSLFWMPIEAANPGIETIRLTPAQAATWKTWLKTKADGTPRRRADSVLSSVRSFYVDLAAWAEQDPSRWAEWAVPSPISFREVRGTARRMRQQKHEMQARTRSLAPHLPAIAAAAKANHQRAVELRDLAHRTPVGEAFDLHGHRYTRLPFGRNSASTGYVSREGCVGRVDTDWQVVTSFMTWSIVEVLRYTGIRVEELLRTQLPTCQSGNTASPTAPSCLCCRSLRARTIRNASFPAAPNSPRPWPD